MKKIMKKNQFIIAALAVMIVVAGYLNLTQKDSKTTNKKGAPTEAATNVSSNDVKDGAGEFADIADEEIPVSDDGSLILKENQKPGETTPEGKDGETTETGTKTDDDTPGNAVLASTELSPDFFVSAKLSREQTRSKNKETLMAIVQDKTISDDLKKDAMAALVAMTKNAEKEDVCESLLGARGFEEIVVHIEEGGINVIVNAATLSEQELAQIEDVIIKETGVKLEKIIVQHAITTE